MCVVSMVGDHYKDKWTDDYYWFPEHIPAPHEIWPPKPYAPQPNPDMVLIDREEIKNLKRDIEEMKRLLKRAKKYDEDNGEPDCEVDEKMELLRKMAEVVGIDLDDVIGATTD